jgi:hypothetical protein
MPPLARASSFPLTGPGVERLERRLRTDESRLREALGDQTFAGPVCAVAFVYVHQPPAIPLMTHAYALTRPALEAAFARHGDEQGLWVLWSPADWDHAELPSWPSDEIVDEAERLATHLRRARCRDPEGAFICELAYRVARADWSDVMTVTDDFASWAMEHEETEDVFETFRVTAPPNVVSTYVARGWLRFPDEYSLQP